MQAGECTQGRRRIQVRRRDFLKGTLAIGVGVTAWGAGGGLGRAQGRVPIHALYIPLADHYAAAVMSHATYAAQMRKVAYTVELMQSWPSLQGKFLAGQADVAFVIAPMAMDMFAQKPQFRCVSLVHRDGNALAVNEFLARQLSLPNDRRERKPNAQVAEAMAAWKRAHGTPSICGLPALLSTHAVVLYKYLKDHGKTLALGEGDGDVLAKPVPPSAAPEFLQHQAKEGNAASFEQSLPWADVVETGGYGKVVWYSKDVLPWPDGHVECIMLASDNAIEEKREALQEVITAIHRAGCDIDAARALGGFALRKMAMTINKHLPLHTVEAITQSLRADLAVINYANLNVDKAGLRHIMQLAVEAKILKQPVDLDAFADTSFATDFTSTHG